MMLKARPVGCKRGKICHNTHGPDEHFCCPILIMVEKEKEIYCLPTLKLTKGVLNTHRGLFVFPTARGLKRQHKFESHMFPVD